MADRRSSPTKVKRACFDAHKWTHPITGRIMLTCHLCGGDIDAAKGTRRDSPDAWDAEHVTRWALTKDDSPENVKPAHVACHRPKTAEDNSATAKGKRVRDKHFGISRRKGFFRPAGMKFDWSQGRYVKVSEES